MDWHIGCSGFHYKEWKNTFYQPGLPVKEWFSYYCTRFNSLELNNTFYQFPQVARLQKWYDASPATFLFAVKAPQLITHYKQFNEVEKLMDDFYFAVENGLKNKLGPLLFQLPPRLAYDDKWLARITRYMRKDFKNVVEFRHSSWWKKEVMEELASLGISFCGQSYPGLPDQVPEISPFVYYRFHGVPVLYKSAYTKSKLKEIGNSILAKKVNAAFIYFNNTMTVAAIQNAEYLHQYFSSKQLC